MESFIGEEGGHIRGTGGGVVVCEFYNRQLSNPIVLCVGVVGP